MPDTHETTQSNFLSIGRRTLGVDPSSILGATLQRLDSGKLTRAQTETNNDLKPEGQEEDVATEKKIWMEVMKYKATKGYEGGDRVPRT